MWRDDTSFSLQKYSLSPQLDETYAFPTSRNLEFSDALLIFCFPTLSLLAFIAHQLLICIICYMKTCFHMPTIALADKTGCKPGKLLPPKCPTLPLVVTINTLNASRKKKNQKWECSSSIIHTDPMTQHSIFFSLPPIKIPFQFKQQAFTRRHFLIMFILC